MEVRYTHMKDAAESFSIISIGICFATSDNHLSIFEISVSKERVNIDKNTAQFLIKHGFNFRDLFENSITYSKVCLHELLARLK